MPTYRVKGPDGRTFTVQAPEGASEADVLAFIKAQSGAAGPPAPAADPVAEDAKTVPWTQALAIGAGRGMQDVIQGVKQIALEGVQNPMQGTLLAPMSYAAGQLFPGIRKGAETAAASQREQQADELEAFGKLSDASPVAATTGRILGNVAAAPLPAGGATVPARMIAGAGSGAALGAAQYVPEGGSRATNALVGGAVGGALPAGIEGMKLTVANVKLLAGKLKDAMPNVSQAARERAAAQMIRDAAGNPAALSNLADSPIAGVQRTLAEASDDPGLSGLQRTLVSMDPRFAAEAAARSQANNAARVQAIQAGFGGADEASARAIEAARDKATAPLLAAARKVKGVDITPTLTLTRRIIKAREGNDTVTGVLSSVKEIMEREGMDSVQKLHNVRQEIGNIMSGLSTKDQSGKLAMRELMTIRQSLDKQIGNASPEFRQFLKQYAELSKEAGKVRMGEELLGKSFATLDSAGNPVLSPAKFAGAANDLDRVAQMATGFRKETAERLMSPDQRALVGNLRADLDRFARSQVGGKAVGSNTAQNMAGMSRVQDAALGGQMTSPLLPTSLNGPLAVLNGLRQHYGAKTVEIVQQMMMNPRQAQAMLAKYPPAQRQQVMTLLDSPRFQQFMAAAQNRTPVAGGSLAAPGEPQQ